MSIPLNDIIGDADLDSAVTWCVLIYIDEGKK